MATVYRKNNVEKQIPFFLVVISEEDKAAAANQSSASLVTMLLTFGTSILISIALGGTVEATWLLFGCIQLMSFVPLFNLNLPANFREFAKNLAVLHGEPEAIPNFFEKFIDPTGLEPYNEFFYLMNFKTKVLLMNAGRKLEIWCAMFMFMGVTWLLYDLVAEWSKLGKIVRMLDIKARYGMLIRGV